MGLSGPGHGKPSRGKTSRITRSGKKSSSRIPLVRQHEAEIRSIGPADDSRPLHERVQSASPASLDQPGDEPRTKTTRSITRRGAAASSRADADRTRRGSIPVKKSNPLPLILGVGGGVFLLLVIIIAAASSGGAPVRRPPPPKAPPPPAPVVQEVKEDIPDTGWVTFICSGSEKHEDEEVVWGRRCPSCNGRAPFLWDDTGSKFKCWECKKIFTKAEVHCPLCGKVSFNPRIKPRPR